MFRFAALVLRRATPAAFISLLSALLLQACGGGGATDPSDTEARYEAQMAQLASHFTVTEVNVTMSRYNEATTQGANQLLVIDTRTSEVVQRITLAPEESLGGASFMQTQWATTSREKRDADQSGSSDLGVSQLFYIQDGILMQQDLSGDRLGTPRRLSSLPICGITWGHIRLDPEGKTGWLPVRVAGEGGDCSDAAKITNQLLKLDSLPDDPSALTTPNQQFLAILSDANGLPLGILAMDDDEGKVRLVLLSVTDLSTRLQSLTLNASSASAERIHVMGPVFGMQQALIQIGQDIHQLDWLRGTLRVGSAILTMHEPYPSLTGDTEHVYLADGCVIHQIDPDGTARHFLTIPGDAGEVGRLLNVGKQLLVEHWRNGNPPADQPRPPSHGCGPEAPAHPPILRVISKSTGAMTRIIQDLDTNWFDVLGHANEQLYVVSSRMFDSDIVRYDLNSGAQTMVAEHVAQIYEQARTRHFRFGEMDIGRHQLLWCKLSRENSEGCEAGDDIISHTVATGRDVVLGKMPSLRGKVPDHLADEGAFASFHTASEGFWANTPGVLTLSANFYSPEGFVYLSAPWMVTPGVADSLREIPYDLGWQP